jgi:hypothetical protein
MSRKSKFYNQEGACFVSFAVVEWIDVFTGNEYKNFPGSHASYFQTRTGKIDKLI